MKNLVILVLASFLFLGAVVKPSYQIITPAKPIHTVIYMYTVDTFSEHRYQVNNDKEVQKWLDAGYVIKTMTSISDYNRAYIVFEKY